MNCKTDAVTRAVDDVIDGFLLDFFVANVDI